jgi:hypothetical protein
LWNNDRTVLTLWLDPGRIKRGLQPNLAMGPPLTRNNKYTLIVKQEWKNQEGVQLQRNFIKDFVTVEYDSLSPEPAGWKIRIPKPGTTSSLNIDFNESLDYMLVKNAIHITDAVGMGLPGAITVFPGETGFSFIPAVPWKETEYNLVVETRMEDLAGNNLEHLFDNDLTQNHKPGTGENYVKVIRVR